MLPPVEYKRRVATAILSFASLLWSLIFLFLADTAESMCITISGIVCIYTLSFPEHVTQFLSGCNVVVTRNMLYNVGKFQTVYLLLYRELIVELS